MATIKRLFLFPEIPGIDNGYRIAVLNDFNHFEYNENDLVVFWSLNPEMINEDILRLKSEKGFKLVCFKRNRSVLFRLRSVFCLKHPSYFWNNELFAHIHKDNELDFIFCGDTIFYPFTKKNLTCKKLDVRFHNLWLKIRLRKQLFSIKSGSLFLHINKLYSSWNEKRIFNDSLCFKWFINKSDEYFYRSVTSKSDCDVMTIIPKINSSASTDLCLNEIVKPKILPFIWFGSAATHTKDGICWFIKAVYLPLYKEGVPVSLDLFGSGTEQFTQKKYNISGHGKFLSENIPMDGHGVFINPDLTGRGLKLKVGYFLENNLVFISTFFGMDGYDEYGSKENVILAHPSDWLATLKAIFLKVVSS